MLNGESQTDIEGVLERARWIVISITGVSNGQVSLLQRFFSERPNLLRDRNVILFAFTAPYYLDPTDISKLTAYYALYSKGPAFVEVAARLLFQQVSFQDASPVSIPAVGYDLLDATSPYADQIIPLALDPGVEEVTPTVNAGTLTPPAEPTQTPVPQYQLGDTIYVRAGPIVDHNQNIVPDKTVVHFTMTTQDETGIIPQEIESETIKGMARAAFAIDRPGKVEIRAASEPALVSNVLQFDASNVPAVVTVVAPTQITPTVQATPTITLTPTAVNDLVTPEGYPRVGIWLLMVVAVLGGAFLMFWAISRIISPRWGLRWGLCVLLGGLAGYNYLALDFPGAANWIASSAGAFGVLLLTFAGQLIGALAAWIWMQVFSGPTLPGD
jgi:beta-N-acetylhexosaminidase